VIWGGKRWMQQAQDRVQWRTLAGNLTVELLLASQEEYCCIELVKRRKLL
jgi:hypothetical protein